MNKDPQRQTKPDNAGKLDGGVASTTPEGRPMDHEEHGSIKDADTPISQWEEGFFK